MHLVSVFLVWWIVLYYHYRQLHYAKMLHLWPEWEHPKAFDFSEIFLATRKMVDCNTHFTKSSFSFWLDDKLKLCLLMLAYDLNSQASADKDKSLKKVSSAVSLVPNMPIVMAVISRRWLPGHCAFTVSEIWADLFKSNSN